MQNFTQSTLTNTIHFHFKQVSHRLKNDTDTDNMFWLNVTASCYSQNNSNKVCPIIFCQQACCALSIHLYLLLFIY